MTGAKNIFQAEYESDEVNIGILTVALCYSKMGSRALGRGQ